MIHTRYHPDSTASHPNGPCRPPLRPRPVTRPHGPPTAPKAVQGSGSGISMHLHTPHRFAPTTGSLSGSYRSSSPHCFYELHCRRFQLRCQAQKICEQTTWGNFTGFILKVYKYGLKVSVALPSSPIAVFIVNSTQNFSFPWFSFSVFTRRPRHIRPGLPILTRSMSSQSPGRYSSKNRVSDVFAAAGATWVHSPAARRAVYSPNRISSPCWQ